MAQVPVKSEKFDITQPLGSMNSIRSLLDKQKGEFEKLLGKQLDPTRFVRLAISAAQRNQGLLKCDAASFLGALMDASRLKLEPGVPGGLWLTPRNNRKTGKSEVLGIIDYRALIAIARRGGEVGDIAAHIVREGETFTWVRGDDEKIIHEGNQPNAPAKYVYAIARYKDGRVMHREVMSYDEVEAIRQRAPAGSSGPWTTDPGEMAKKTVIRRLCKYLPQTEELRDALQVADKEFEGTDASITLDLDTQIQKAQPVVNEDAEPPPEQEVEDYGTPPGPPVQSRPSLIHESEQSLRSQIVDLVAACMEAGKGSKVPPDFENMKPPELTSFRDMLRRRLEGK